MLRDDLSRPPPSGGAYGYDTFAPGRPGFIARGQSYVDPIYGERITRLTSEYPQPSGSDLYAKNGWWNSDGTRLAHKTPSGNLTIIDTTTGAVIRSNVPGDADGSFDPVDPDVWYFFEGAKLCEYSVARGIAVVIRMFDAPLGKLGGSLDWIDKSGRYMVLNIGGKGRVWDRRDDVLYAGALPGDVAGGWLALSPDARYVVSPWGPSVEGVGQPIRSYAINHQARTVNTTGVMFWSLGGDHGDLVSTGGKTYLVAKESHSDPGIWRVDVSIPQTMTTLGLAKQRKDNRKLIALDWKDNDGHISCAGEWAFVSVESTDDPHGGGGGTWRPYKQEILMVHVLTGEIRRLAHHRSRGLGDGVPEHYRWQPRVCASWDGLRVAWASNMGSNKPGYADIYAIHLGATVTPVVPPVVPPPVQTPAIEIILRGAAAGLSVKVRREP